MRILSAQILYFWLGLYVVLYELRSGIGGCPGELLFHNRGATRIERLSWLHGIHMYYPYTMTAYVGD
jgi:hypothetical protein